MQDIGGDMKSTGLLRSEIAMRTGGCACASVLKICPATKAEKKVNKISLTNLNGMIFSSLNAGSNYP